jgi:hypothetical protein
MKKIIVYTVTAIAIMSLGYFGVGFYAGYKILADNERLQAVYGRFEQTAEECSRSCGSGKKSNENVCQVCTWSLSIFVERKDIIVKGLRIDQGLRWESYIMSYSVNSPQPISKMIIAFDPAWPLKLWRRFFMSTPVIPTRSSFLNTD